MYIFFCAVTTPAPNLILNCDSTYNNNGTINVFITWHVAEPAVPWPPETIARFNISTSLINVVNEELVVDEQYPNIIVSNNVSKDAYAFH